MNSAEPLGAPDAVVSALAHAVNAGGASLSSVPGLVKRVIREACWRERAVQALRGEVQRFRRFDEFVSMGPPRGLGSDVKTLKRLCADDVEAIKAIEEAETGEHGGDRHSKAFKVRNTNLESTVQDDAGYIVRRLDKQRPDLYAKVVAGVLSPHAAAVEAGFRERKLQVSLDPLRAARSLGRHFRGERRAQLLAALEREEDGP